MNRDIPYVRIVIVFCFAAIIAYAGFSAYVMLEFRDATMIGDIVGTWKSFAVAAFAYWLGSSSGGKATPTPVPENATDAADQTAKAAAEEAERIRKAQEESEAAEVAAKGNKS